MLIDITLPPLPWDEIPEHARKAEEIGFDCIWMGETSRDPFIPLALAAEHTKRIKIGTSVCVAFPRSPMTVAYTAWDLQTLSHGRFVLGLGTQVRGHMERRFSVRWDPPGSKMREYVSALRTIWDCWQNGRPLNFRGGFYNFSLMTPFFDPGPIKYPHIPIHLAGVNPYMCRLAGEVCDGLHIHPFHSPKYVKEVVLPNIEKGLRESGRKRKDVQLVAGVFIVTGGSEEEIRQTEEYIRFQIAFYASTKTYKKVMELHGWGEISERLYRKSLKGDWASMAGEITDDIFETFAVKGKPHEVIEEVKNRHRGLADRLILYPIPALAHLETSMWGEVI